MRPIPTHFVIALTLAALALSSCARRSDLPASTLGQDDDAFCRSTGAVAGSADYANCLKNRDVQRGNAIARTDRAQRNLGEYMLNNPGRP
ncbi:MAG: hypothetical protein ABWY14_11630 [Tardiphaga sp.]